MDSSVLDESSFFYVGNIPGQFHSSDLRAFFSHLIERKGFVCFHFRHRPEQLVTSKTTQSEQEGDVQCASSGAERERRKELKTNCCVVAVVRKLEGEFLRYRNKNWSHPDGELLPQRVRISRLRVTDSSSASAGERNKGFNPFKMDAPTSLQPTLAHA